MDSSRQIILAAALCIVVTLFGAAGYVFIEGYSVLDALYMAVITITTVGFGEVQPLSEVGRGFTTFLILIGVVSLAYMGRALAESVVDTVWRGKLRTKKMKKKISRLQDHYIICGYGRVGVSSADYLQRMKVDFVLIESNPEACDKLDEKGLLYVNGDATNDDALIEAGIKSASGLITLLDSDPENLFVVLTARELNPTLYIISRAEDQTSGKKITRAGADKVYSLFATAGKQVAIDIVRTTGRRIDGEAAFESEAAPRWIDIDETSDLRNLGIAQVKKEKGLTIIGFRRGNKDSIFPDPAIRLKTSDRLLVIGSEHVGDSYAERLSKYKKLVIVDDNPMIVRVFSRLFQKEGFFPITANDGHEGLNRIIEEKPVAAVIDFMLPVISGVELCREVKEIEACDGIKLILFTADGSPETRARALEAGADAVVVKSSDASEIIKAVIEILEDGSKQEEMIESEPEAEPAVEPPVMEIATESAVEEAPDRKRMSEAIDAKAALTNLMDDESLLQEIFDDFIDDHPPMLEDIRLAIASGDASAVDKTAHRFKGTLLCLAANSAAEEALGLEMMGKTDELTDAEEAFQSLVRECEAIKGFIREYKKQG